MPKPKFPIPADPKERRMGMTEDRYLNLFLEASDFNPRMRPVQDSRLQGPDPRDVWFAKHQGILTGFAVWMGSPSATIWRVVDIRTAFPTAWQASSWHSEALGYNSESTPPVAGAPAVGQECRVFGGLGPDVLGVGVRINAFFYLFRVGRIAVKLFAAQGMEASAPLTPAHVADMASRVVARIERVERT